MGINPRSVGAYSPAPSGRKLQPSAALRRLQGNKTQGARPGSGADKQGGSRGFVWWWEDAASGGRRATAEQAAEWEARPPCLDAVSAPMSAPCPRTPPRPPRQRPLSHQRRFEGDRQRRPRGSAASAGRPPVAFTDPSGFYRALGLSALSGPSASPSALHAAFRQAALRNHPARLFNAWAAPCLCPSSAPSIFEGGVTHRV